MFLSHKSATPLLAVCAKRWLSNAQSENEEEALACERLLEKKSVEWRQNFTFKQVDGWSREFGNLDDMNGSIKVFVKPEELNAKISKNKNSILHNNECVFPCDQKYDKISNSHHYPAQCCQMIDNKRHSEREVKNISTHAATCSKNNLLEKLKLSNNCYNVNKQTEENVFKENLTETKLSKNKRDLHREQSSLPKRTNLTSFDFSPTTEPLYRAKVNTNEKTGNELSGSEVTVDNLQKSNTSHELNTKVEIKPIHEEKFVTANNNLPRKCTETSLNEKKNIDDAKSDESRHEYYRSISKNILNKQELWNRIKLGKSDNEEKSARPLEPDDVDYLKIVTDLKECDLFHYRIGEMAYCDKLTRQDYYGMWALAMSLNKARWSMMQAHTERGMKTTGAGVKLLYWKESVSAIIDKGGMVAGQFSEQHPVLRVFGDAVQRHPKMTKTFVRGFTDARLRILQQPGNIKQLYDYYDKFYGYFFNSLLQIVGIKDEAAEHLMLHIGRALGLSLHTVMFWKKYARMGFTMLPADLCADHRVNVALLRNIPLSSIDFGVRSLLHEVMCIVKSEMMNAESIAQDVTPLAWPIVMECTYPNYHLMWLQRKNFDVSALLADYNVENPGLTWYRLKKQWEWKRFQSIKKLVAEPAPLPIIGTSWRHRGSQIKQGSLKGEMSKYEKICAT